MINPKFEQIRGIEINALLFQAQQEEIFHPNSIVPRIGTNSNGRLNCLRVFHLLAKQWLPVDYHVGLHAKPVKKQGKLNPDLHPPIVTLVHTLATKLAEYDMYLLIECTNRSAAQAMGITPDTLHSNEWLNQAHFPFIDNMVSEFISHENIIFETCNESMGSNATLAWELAIAERIKLNGGKFIAASPLNTPVAEELIFKKEVDFVCFHGLWTDYGINYKYPRYREHGTNVWFSGDGRSDLTGNKASDFLQWNESQWGYLPKPWYHRKLIQQCAVRNNGYFHNTSGAVEIPEPRWPYFDQCCKEYDKAFEL